MQMEVGMVKKSIAFHIHSLIDLITNSSSELFVVSTDKATDFTKELLGLITEQFNKGWNDSKVTKYADISYKDEFDLPEGVNPDNVYFIDVDHSESLGDALIKKYFTILDLKWKV